MMMWGTNEFMNSNIYHVIFLSVPSTCMYGQLHTEWGQGRCFDFMHTEQTQINQWDKTAYSSVIFHDVGKIIPSW